VIKNRWKWSLVATLGLMLPLLSLDIVFLGANSLKIVEGGYVPLAIAAILILIMWTWRSGTKHVQEKMQKMDVKLNDLVQTLVKRPPHSVPGTAVFFTSNPDTAPTALLHSFKHYKVLHENNIVLTVKTTDTPTTDDSQKLRITKLSENFTSIIASVGYMETPDVPKLLELAKKNGVTTNAMTTSYFLSRRSVQTSNQGRIQGWQNKLFILMSRNADDTSHYFKLPPDRVVEIGTQITI
jgi:KUP system potassium uptake protein